MAPLPHRVRRLSLQVKAPSQTEALALRKELRDGLETALFPALERAFDEAAPGDALIHIPAIHVRVRLSGEGDVARELAREVEQELHEQLGTVIPVGWDSPAPAAGRSGAEAERRDGSTGGGHPATTSLQARVQMLREYLETGSAPWPLAHVDPAAALSELREAASLGLLDTSDRQPGGPASFPARVAFWFRWLQLLPEESWPALARAAALPSGEPGAAVAEIVEALAGTSAGAFSRHARLELAAAAIAWARSTEGITDASEFASLVLQALRAGGVEGAAGGAGAEQGVADATSAPDSGSRAREGDRAAPAGGRSVDAAEGSGTGARPSTRGAVPGASAGTSDRQPGEPVSLPARVAFWFRWLQLLPEESWPALARAAALPSGEPGAAAAEIGEALAGTSAGAFSRHARLQLAAVAIARARSTEGITNAGELASLVLQALGAGGAEGAAGGAGAEQGIADATSAPDSGSRAREGDRAAPAGGRSVDATEGSGTGARPSTRGAVPGASAGTSDRQPGEPVSFPARVAFWFRWLQLLPEESWTALARAAALPAGEPGAAVAEIVEALAGTSAGAFSRHARLQLAAAAIAWARSTEGITDAGELASLVLQALGAGGVEGAGGAGAEQGVADATSAPDSRSRAREGDRAAPAGGRSVDAAEGSGTGERPSTRGAGPVAPAGTGVAPGGTRSFPSEREAVARQIARLPEPVAAAFRAWLAAAPSAARPGAPRDSGTRSDAAGPRPEQPARPDGPERLRVESHVTAASWLGDVARSAVTGARPAPSGQMVHHAGLVLLHPFLPRFFESTGVKTAGQPALEPDALPRAAALLHLLAAGEAEVFELALDFIKVLLGLPIDAPLPVSDGLLRAADVEEAEALLSTVIQYWSALGKTSTKGLRSSFLTRSGLLREEDQGFRLQVEPAPFDMLLGYLPWGIGTVRLPWTNKAIFTEWQAP